MGRPGIFIFAKKGNIKRRRRPFGRKKIYVNPHSFKWLKKYYKKVVATTSTAVGYDPIRNKMSMDYKKLDWERGYFRRCEVIDLLKGKCGRSYDSLVKKGAIKPIRPTKSRTLIPAAQLEEEFLRREILINLQDSRHKADTRVKKKHPKEALYLDFNGTAKFMGWYPKNRHKILGKFYQKILEHKYILFDKECPYSVGFRDVEILFNAVCRDKQFLKNFDVVTWAKSKSRKWKYLCRQAAKSLNT